jgi:hypothetical protein
VITNDGINHLPTELFSAAVASSPMLQLLFHQVIFSICGNDKHLKMSKI